LLTTDVIRNTVAQVPVEWLAGEPGVENIENLRDAYVAQIERRLAARAVWLPPLVADARSGLGRLTLADRAGRPATRPTWLARGDAS